MKSGCYRQRFHLEGNWEGNSIWKENGRKYCYKEGNEKEILFYLIISKNKAIFTQFCAVLEHLGQDPRIPILKYQPNLIDSAKRWQERP
jgi:hypothetical protein